MASLFHLKRYQNREKQIMTKIKNILFSFLFLLLMFFSEFSGYSADINRLISSLKQEKYNLYIMSKNKKIFQINEAENFFKEICDSIEIPSIGIEPKKFWGTPPIFKVELKNARKAQINFCLPLWRCFLGDNNKAKHSFVVMRSYDTKLHIVIFQRIFYLIGEKEAPPQIASWFNPQLKIFLSNYFEKINKDSPIYFKRLAFFFEEIGKNKEMHGNYSFLEGKVDNDLSYINKLISFLKTKDSQLMFSDYAGIVYPICNKFSTAPQYIEYPVGEPEKIIDILKSPKSIIDIQGGYYKNKVYSISQVSDILNEISKTLSSSLEPEQLPYTMGIHPQPKIVLNVKISNKNKILIGLSVGRLLTNWSYFSPKLKRWVYYEVAKTADKKEKFCSLYKKIQALIDKKKLDSTQ